MSQRARTLLAAIRVVDILALPFTALAGMWLKLLRRLGLHRVPASKRLLLSIGILPVRDHYYEPMINPRHLRLPLSRPRNLPAIDLNVDQQLAFLEQFTFQSELLSFPLDRTDRLEFYYRNASFMSGDAEYLYSLIRAVKPRKIIEIGCGHSTMMAQNAIAHARLHDNSYACEQICIEPYEQPWLNKLNVKVMRVRAEECDLALFGTLSKGDILFIDSSHVIRPQGDVLYEYLEVLPILRSGVYVHIHDIFTPRDYLREWVVDEIKLWNEQYLLEGFLSFNRDFRVIGALNYLTHEHPGRVAERFPVLKTEIESREPGSFWLVRE
jgi:hypothetical protein